MSVSETANGTNVIVEAPDQRKLVVYKINGQLLNEIDLSAIVSLRGLLHAEKTRRGYLITDWGLLETSKSGRGFSMFLYVSQGSGKNSLLQIYRYSYDHTSTTNYSHLQAGHEQTSKNEVTLQNARIG